MKNFDRSRIVRLLVLLLQKSQSISIQELAERMDVDRRTIYREIDALREVGFTIDTNGHNVRISHRTPVVKHLVELNKLNDSERISLSLLNIRHDILYAIQQRIQVVLVGYSSPSSNTTCDRLVEPFMLSEDAEFVWAFELASNCNKVFRLSRIQSIKLLEETPWLQSRFHKAGYTDAFHMISFDNRKTFVCIRMQRRAYNLLIEEYPATKSHIIYNEESGEWIYEDYVSNMVGIGRFVVGLSDCITVETPELRSYISYFVQKNILKLRYPEDN